MNDRRSMTLAAAVLALLLAVPAAAGTVKGKLKLADAQQAERTVVYIEEVPESSFTPPSATPVKLSQKRLALLTRRAGGAQGHHGGPHQ